MCPSKVEFGWLLCGPPCHLYVFMSSSFHCRSIDFPYGDQSKFAVRRANQIVINLLAMLCIAHSRKVFFLFLVEFGNFLIFLRKKDCPVLQSFVSKIPQYIRVRLEQPGSSMMWIMPEMVEFILWTCSQRVHSWMKCFGHELPKPSVFVSNINFECLEFLERKWSKKMEKRLQRTLVYQYHHKFSHSFNLVFNQLCVQGLVFAQKYPFKLGYILISLSAGPRTTCHCDLQFQNPAAHVGQQGDLLQNSFEVPQDQQDEDPKAPEGLLQNPPQQIYEPQVRQWWSKTEIFGSLHRKIL